MILKDCVFKKCQRKWCKVSTGRLSFDVSFSRDVKLWNVLNRQLEKYSKLTG
jgi:hypothetical protein